MGKMNQIIHCDWLPERSKWSYFARSGLPAVFHKKNCQEGHTINPLMTKCEVNMAGYWFCFCEFMDFESSRSILGDPGAVSGDDEKSKTGQKNSGEENFSSPKIFFHPFRLFPVPTNCPWVSEDGLGP